MSGRGMSIEIRAEGLDRAVEKMSGALAGLGGKEAAKAVASALNQSLAQGRKEARTLARQAYTAPARKIFDQIDIQRAQSSQLLASLNIRGKRGVSLIHFKARPNEAGTHPAGGVTVQVIRKGPRHVRKSGRGGSLPFIMKKKQGGQGVFVSHGLKKKIMGPGKRKALVVKKRIFDLEMLFGPSPIQALQRKDRQDRIVAAIEDSFGPELATQIDKALAGMGAR